MSESNPPPAPPLPPEPPLPPLPSALPVPPLPTATLAVPGERPEEREPIGGVLGVAEAILRQPRRVMYQLQQPGAGGLVARMALVGTVCLGVYGFIVGTFSGGLQLWAAPLKITLGLFVSAVICLPSLYIFTCLSGSQARLREVVGYVTGMLLLTSVLLVGFAPVAWIFSQSTESVGWMGFLHLLFWFIAVLFGLRFLAASFAHAKAKSETGLYVWIVVFMLTALQMITAVRPLVGKADTLLPAKKMFFAAHWAEMMDTKP